MDKELLVASLATIGTLTVTSIYGLVATAISKRVTIISPEAQADGGLTYLAAGMLYP